ncbi:MAG TPA: NAD(P)H-hydrate dehydratase, partial [Gammaproteobacteria bacterium]|nr:NAD(P)H-hydrate dehydratase [Gammaproteobacteria bacterium]
VAEGARFTPDVVVDALLGTGLAREVEGVFAAAIDRINAGGAPVLALDVPSGLDADRGRPLGRCVRASVTVTFVGLKQGFFLDAGPDYIGDLEFSDLLLPAELPASLEPAFRRLRPALLRASLPPRPRTAHKGQNGRLLLVGGGPGTAGAIRLAAEASLRVGAGLVYVATDRESVGMVLAGRAELMCRPVATAADLDSLLELADAVVLGPGLGKSEWARALWQRVVASSLPLVLDADGLNLLAEIGIGREVEQRIARGDWLLTPHPGEAGRLLGRSATEVQSDRLGAVAELARRYGAAVALKGACTLVATRGGETGKPSRSASGPDADADHTESGTAFGQPAHAGAADQTEPSGAAGEGGSAARVTIHVCDYGNPGMATAGMGDVLSGVLGGLLVQLRDLPRTALTGVLLHALAGDDAAAEGQRGLIAGDLLPALRRWANPC